MEIQAVRLEEEGGEADTSVLVEEAVVVGIVHTLILLVSCRPAQA
jgi:hypothetical protein